MTANNPAGGPAPAGTGVVTVNENQLPVASLPASRGVDLGKTSEGLIHTDDAEAIHKSIVGDFQTKLRDNARDLAVGRGGDGVESGDVRNASAAMLAAPAVKKNAHKISKGAFILFLGLGLGSIPGASSKVGEVSTFDPTWPGLYILLAIAAGIAAYYTK